MTGIAAAAGAPEAGALAPAFKLQDQTGKWHSLSDYKGHWVALYFYPKDDTPGCTTQACSFRDNVFAFKKENAVILGISVDDVASHKRWIGDIESTQKTKMNFPILGDADKKVANLYGMIHPEANDTLTVRSVFFAAFRALMSSSTTCECPSGSTDS